jgi:hypothetical protein
MHELAGCNGVQNQALHTPEKLARNPRLPEPPWGSMNVPLVFYGVASASGSSGSSESREGM